MLWKILGDFLQRILNLSYNFPRNVVGNFYTSYLDRRKLLSYHRIAFLEAILHILWVGIIDDCLIPPLFLQGRLEKEIPTMIFYITRTCSSSFMVTCLMLRYSQYIGSYKIKQSLPKLLDFVTIITQVTSILQLLFEGSV